METPCLALGIHSPHHGREGASVHPIGEGGPQPSPELISSSVQQDFSTRSGNMLLLIPR